MAEKEKKQTQMTQADIDAQVIGIVRGEKQRWEVATAFVTDRVSFKMRQLIRIFRKNYYGIFDNPFDQFTGLEKIWYPLTEINVEAVVKNIDLDTKDINFRSKGDNDFEMTEMTRSLVRDRLKKIDFGQKQDDLARSLAIDGTVVWKTYKEGKNIRVVPVDLLNVYIDPTTPSIQEAYRFTERCLMFPENMQMMTGWRNIGKEINENVPEGLPRVDPYYPSSSSGAFSNVKMRDVYETWGMVPKSLITGIVEDACYEIPAHLVVSGIDSAGNPMVHLVEENKEVDDQNNSKKPYEEAWYTRVPGRWYGRGIAEKVLTLQIYANIVFNVRINRSRISQLGLFKMKKGAGITPQMLQRLPSNGVVVLNNLDDLQQFQIQEVGASSYKDEDVINTISERLTNAFEIVTGERLPSSTPATNAAIQNNNAQSGFTLIKESIGGFYKRWLDRHFVPLVAETMTSGDLVKFMVDDDKFRGIVEKIALSKTEEALDESWKRGYVPSEQEVMLEFQNAMEKLAKSDVVLKATKKIIANEVATEIYITNEEMNVPVTIQNLLNMLNLAPEYRDAIISETFDLMGLAKPKKSQPMQPIQQGAPQGAPPTLQGIQQSALTA